MRIAEFQRHLASSAPSAALPPRPPEEEVFVPYVDLKNHGVNFTRIHLRRLAAKGLFPAPVMLSANRIAWKLSEIVAWKASRPRHESVAAGAATG